MTLAVIQARMTSTRLPGKVLMKVLDKSLLEWQIARLRMARSISSIVIATTTNKTDDAIEDECRRLSVGCFRGDEHDVLSRFYETARREEVAELFRLTGDCPLVDPEIIDHVYRVFREGKYDYVNTGSTFSEGVDAEILGFEALQTAWSLAETGAQREHVTLYINQNRHRFRCLTLENSVDDSAFRFTVDEPADFEVVKAILEGIFPAKPDFRTNDVKAFLKNNPEVASRNVNIVRNEGLIKSLRDDGVEFTRG